MDVRILNSSFWSKESFLLLMKKADKLFTPPISEGIDLKAYSEKLYAYASFVVCRDGKDVKGFAAFYKNVGAKQLYITLICVDKQLQGQGIGGQMLETLELLRSEGFETIALEVVKTNQTAYHFYKKHGFIEQEDRGEKFLMRKTL